MKPLARSLWILLLVSSCKELPAIDAAVCGNGVVEPGAGEDCDRFATTPGSVCRQPGEPQECRYVCTLRDDGTRPNCPHGMLCALDDLCRWPSGHFEKTATSSPALPRALLVGDFDGDRRDDLVAAERARTVVHYYGDRAQPSGELSIPNMNDSGATPLLAELSGDALPDLVVPYTSGIVASLGSEERELVPTAYPTISLPQGIDSAYIFTLEVLPGKPGPETLVLGGAAGANGGALVHLTADLQLENLTFTYSPNSLAGDIPIGNVIEDPITSPCDDIVFLFREVSTLYVFSPCKLDPDPAKGIVLNIGGSAVQTALPDGDTVLGPGRLVDLDGDGHLDLAVVLANGDQRFIGVGYGLGDGTFDSTSPVGATGDGHLAHAGDLGTTTPLAIADLDGDGAVDYVDSKGVFVQRGSSWEIVGASGSDTWSSAVIADLNGNGIQDVFAAVANGAGALFMNGSGHGELSPFAVTSKGSLSHLEVGDYDGDLILDVAAAERSSGPGGDFLSVLFGRSTGAPESAQRMGLIGDALQVATTRASPAGGPQWSLDDVTTFEKTPDQILAFAGFGGRGDRQLRAQFLPVSQADYGTSGLPPRRLASGRFDDDDHRDLAELCDTSFHGVQGFGLWLVPMRDQARVPLSGVRPSAPLPDKEADFLHSELGSGDLDGDGIDELVLLAPATKPGGGSLGYVARALPGDDGKRFWKLGDATPLEWRFEERQDLDVPSGDPGGGRLVIADLDADGDQDVLALAPAQTNAPGVLVELRGTGGLNLGDAIVLPDTPDGPATAFALIQADRDPAFELALLASSRVYLADFVPGESYVVASTPVAEVSGAELIAAGDFDADGVPDLALGTASSVAVLRGIPGMR
jgi:FG-GAP-like repeat